MAHYTKSHRYKQLHFTRFLWLAFLISGLTSIQLVYNFQTTNTFKVLAYSTNVSRGDLFVLSNNERTSNGLAAFALNTQLNNAAQAKADHMIANNYWSHNAPDGTTPWYFFDQAGYAYSNAGENLAYGFADSAGVTQGWMNSPGHKANIMGNYKDVGYGFTNGPNYQNGQNTVVVAMYGTASGYQAPAEAPSATASPSPAAPPSQSASQPAPIVPQPTAEPINPSEPNTPVPITNNKPSAVPNISEQKNVQIIPKTDNSPETVATLKNAPTENKAITTIQQAINGSAVWPFYASLVVIAISTVGFCMTHIRLMHLAWANGSHFVFTHPLIDTAAATAVLVIFFSFSTGYIH